jgi:hypothetical protein
MTYIYVCYILFPCINNKLFAHTHTPRHSNSVRSHLNQKAINGQSGHYTCAGKRREGNTQFTVKLREEEFLVGLRQVHPKL